MAVRCLWHDGGVETYNQIGPGRGDRDRETPGDLQAMTMDPAPAGQVPTPEEIRAQMARPPAPLVTWRCPVCAHRIDYHPYPESEVASAYDAMDAHQRTCTYQR